VCRLAAAGAASGGGAAQAGTALAAIAPALSRTCFRIKGGPVPLPPGLVRAAGTSQREERQRQERWQAPHASQQSIARMQGEHRAPKSRARQRASMFRLNCALRQTL
jgi:hypothetical protein